MMRALARTLNIPEMPWAHLHHGQGFHCVKMDQSGAQYSGKYVDAYRCSYERIYGHTYIMLIDY